MNKDIKDFGLEFVLTDIALKVVYGELEQAVSEEERLKSIEHGG